MTIQTKVVLKSVFETDDVPTQENFADLIDSFVGSVNGTQPDTLGNVEIAIPTLPTIQNNLTTIPAGSVLDASQGTILNNRLTTHEGVTGNETTPGHLAIQDFLGPNKQRAITADAVQRETVAIRQLITDLTARVAALEGTPTP